MGGPQCMQQLVMMENTQHSHRHPTGRPCHCDTPGGCWFSRPGGELVYSSAVQLSNNCNQTENQLILHSQTIDTHTQSSEEALAQSQIYARTHATSPAHVEAIIPLLVKSLLYSLLFSQARESNLSTKEC